MRPFVVVVALAACSMPEPLPFPAASKDAAPDPAQPGPYPVGVKTLVFVDESRTTPGMDHPRTLKTEIWYPAVEAARAQPKVDYVLYDELPEDLRTIGLTREDLGTLHTEAVRDAQPRMNETFPVIIFSHGQGGIRQQSTFYTVPLASHGYVVVSPDHEGDTVVDLMRERDVDVTSAVENSVHRVRDVSFLIDQLAAFPDDEPLKPILDLEHIGMTGHSFGAYTTFQAAGADYRIDAIVAHAPVGYGIVQLELETPIEEFGIPALIAAGGKDQTLPADPNAESLWNHMVKPRFYFLLERAGHFTFSDLCILDVAAIDEALDVDASNVLDDGCGTENTPPEQAAASIDHYSIALFNGALRDSPGSAALLTEEAGADLAPGEVTLRADP